MEWWGYTMIMLGFFLGAYICKRSWVANIHEYARDASRPMHVDGKFYYIVPEEVFNFMALQLTRAGLPQRPER